MDQPMKVRISNHVRLVKYILKNSCWLILTYNTVYIQFNSIISELWIIKVCCTSILTEFACVHHCQALLKGKLMQK